MNSTNATARLAGLQYVLFSILAIFGYMVVPGRFVVLGDAAATAHKITEGAFLYRMGILASLTGHILFIFLVLTLYRLFEDVDRKQARLMVALVCVGAAAEIVNLANRVAPLVLLSGADYLSAFTQAQRESLALTFLRFGNSLAQLLTAFWGLWLFPFGILTIRSRLFPKFLGVLLLVSGVAYVVTCVVRLLLPDQFSVVSRIVSPLYLGEVVMVLWLAIMGAKESPGRTVGGAGSRASGAPA